MRQCLLVSPSLLTWSKIAFKPFLKLAETFLQIIGGNDIGVCGQGSLLDQISKSGVCASKW